MSTKGREIMSFQLAYGEADVLATSLLIATREYGRRLADPNMAAIHDETAAQLRIATHMYERLTGLALLPKPSFASGAQALSERLAKDLGI